jgi:chromosomal replication initiation ATPase DnaA
MSISPYCFPGIKLDQNDKKKFKSSLKLSKYNVSKEEILEIISQECDVPLSEITTRCRKKEVVNARFIFCAVMKKHFTYSLTRIGGFVHRDHTSVIHAICEFDNRYKNEEHFKSMVNKIYSKIGIYN